MMYFDPQYDLIKRKAKTQSAMVLTQGQSFDAVRRVVLTASGHVDVFCGMVIPISDLNPHRNDFLTVRIVNIQLITLGQLTEAHAHAQGYDSLNELHHAWMLEHGTRNPDQAILIYDYVLTNIFDHNPNSSLQQAFLVAPQVKVSA